MDENKLLERITVNPKIFGGKPIIRGRRLAVEHIIGMLAAGDSPETILKGYPWLEMDDIQACMVYAPGWSAMKGWNPWWWKQGHEDPPGYLRMGRSSPGIAGRHDVVRAGNWQEDPDDDEILERAHREGRVLVTLDKDFGELAIVHERPHSGIIRLVNLVSRQQALICLKTIKLHENELKSGAIITAEQTRLRIRTVDNRQE